MIFGLSDPRVSLPNERARCGCGNQGGDHAPRARVPLDCARDIKTGIRAFERSASAANVHYGLHGIAQPPAAKITSRIGQDRESWGFDIDDGWNPCTPELRRLERLPPPAGRLGLQVAARSVDRRGSNTQQRAATLRIPQPWRLAAGLPRGYCARRHFGSRLS